MDITDHCPTFVHFETPLTNSSASKIYSFRPFNQNAIDELLDKFNHTNWNALLDYDEIDSSIEIFLAYLNSSYCNFFPLKTKTISDKRALKPWLTTHIKKLINKKSRFFKLLRNGQVTRQTNNFVKNAVNREVHKSKTTYYSNLFNESRTNPKKSWDVIHSLSGSGVNKRNSNSDIKLTTETGRVLTDKADVAEKFIDFFASIADSLINNLPHSGLDPCSNIERNTHSFFLRPVLPAECFKVILGLKKGGADRNTMPLHIFKKISSSILEPLCKIINAAYSRGYFPNCLKLARITPVFKRGDKLNPSNYRPISCLPYICKIFEKLLATRLLSYFDKFSLFSPCQFGFLKNLSTLDAMINLTESIYDSLNCRKYHISVLVDIRKAFDSVSHNILLNKLEKYGVRSTSLELLKSYLVDRPSYVAIDSIRSREVKSNIGVPQGSILGPILFLIYVNDLPNFSSIIKTTMFADDTTLSLSHSDLNSALDAVSLELESFIKWTDSNRLSINVDKTEALLFSNRARPNDSLSIRMNTQEVSFSSSCRFLGVYLDDNLNFANHISHIVNKLSRSTGILYKIRDFLPTQAKLSYYYAFMYPYLSYNIVVWGGTSMVYFNKLIVQQKRIIRILGKVPPRTHTSELFHRFGILKLVDLYKFQVLIYMYKAMSENRFTIQHTVNTRQRNLAVPQFHRLTTTQRAISFVGPTLWNKIPIEIRSERTLSLFKRSLKNYFLNLYIPTTLT